MAEFKTNVPVVQKDPVVTVEVSRGSPFPAGPQRFRLVVVDSAGNYPPPCIVTVTIVQASSP